MDNHENVKSVWILSVIDVSEQTFLYLTAFL